MPSPYSNTEISQTGDPPMGQVGAQNANVNDNLYAASYPGAPGRTADSSAPAGGGTDLVSQGLMKLQSGDQYGGITTLLDAAQQNPQFVNNPAFLQQLQIVDNQQAGTASSTSDASQFSAPTDSPAYGATSDTSALTSQQGGAAQGGDANSIAQQALSVAQSNPTEGILGLMQAATVNPDLMNNQNFLTTMSEVLPQGPGAAGAQGQPGADGTQQPQTQQPMDASQQQQTQQPMDASQQPQTQQPMDASQQQPTAAQAYTMPAQLTSSGDPQIEAGVKQAFQMIQSGDQFDGARLLMMIAKADPAILQDQAFVKNLTDLENAVKGGATASTDQTAVQSQQQVDAQGNPVDAQGNPIQMTDAQGNPIAQPGAQQVMTDAQGNPIAQPGSQQVMTDAQGNPVAAPTDTQAQAQVATDPNSAPPNSTPAY